MCLVPSMVYSSPSNKPSLSIDTNPNQTSSNKPSLSINTNPNQTGNEGLDTEGKWRKKAGNCEHKSVSYLTGNTVDGSADIPCDFSSDLESEAGKSTRDKEIYPAKHPAFKDQDDVAYLCDNCLGVICKDCRIDYSSEEEETPTPSKITFPEFKQSSSSSSTDNKETSKKGSLLDDYADTSTEMPDYLIGDE
jgi:hypothetical protein